MVLRKHGCVLCQKSLLLHFDYVGLVEVLGHLYLALSQLDCALLSVNDELVLPQTLDFTSVLELAHSSLLLGHLLETLVFGKLGQQLLLEVLFEAFLFGGTLSLQSHLEILGFLELALGLVLLLLSFTLALSGSELVLLYVELIPKVLAELILGAAHHLLIF